MKLITNVQWKKTHADFKSTIKGQKFILDMVNGATALVPVQVVKLEAIEKEVERLFYQFGNGVQINILNLGKITQAGVDAYLAGGNLQEAVIEAIAKYKEN